MGNFVEQSKKSVTHLLKGIIEVPLDKIAIKPDEIPSYLKIDKEKSLSRVFKFPNKGRVYLVQYTQGKGHLSLEKNSIMMISSQINQLDDVEKAKKWYRDATQSNESIKPVFKPDDIVTTKTVQDKKIDAFGDECSLYRVHMKDYVDSQQMYYISQQIFLRVRKGNFILTISEISVDNDDGYKKIKQNSIELMHIMLARLEQTL